MCMGIPARVVSLIQTAGGSQQAMVEYGSGRSVTVELILVPEVGVGDHVIVHSGYAVATVSPETAEATLALLAEANSGER